MVEVCIDGAKIIYSIDWLASMASVRFWISRLFFVFSWNNVLHGRKRLIRQGRTGKNVSVLDVFPYSEIVEMGCADGRGMGYTE